MTQSLTRFGLCVGAALLLYGLLAGCQSKPETTATQPALTDSVTKAATDATTDSASPFYCVPGLQAGPIRATTTEADLIRLLGAENVVRDTIPLGEGDWLMGTTLYKGTPDEAQILWTDDQHFAKPESVIIRPAGTGQSRWVTNHGLSVGKSLKEVEEINGKPFKLSGFDWDYGGTVTDWMKGKLQSSYDVAVLQARFGYEGENPAAEKVSGDRDFSSADPNMQALNPVVTEMIIRFK